MDHGIIHYGFFFHSQLLINAVVWALLLLICSSLIADDAADIKKVLDSAYKRLGVRVSSSYDSIAAAAVSKHCGIELR